MSQILPLIRRLAQNAGDRSGDGRLEKFFIFRFGDKSYAIPAVDVTEVAMPGSLIEVPQKSDLIRGVVNIRGTVIPIINLRQRIGVAPDYQLGENSRLLLFTVRPNAFIGMIADDINIVCAKASLSRCCPISPNPAKNFSAPRSLIRSACRFSWSIPGLKNPNLKFSGMW